MGLDREAARATCRALIISNSSAAHGSESLVLWTFRHWTNSAHPNAAQAAHRGAGKAGPSRFVQDPPFFPSGLPHPEILAPRLGEAQETGVNPVSEGQSGVGQSGVSSCFFWVARGKK
jgi:hypothetical protein